MNKFAGERLDKADAVSRNNLLEHQARYKRVEGDSKKVVLDIGCGTGYGSARFAGIFKKVFAIDISEEAILSASKKHQNKNIEFKIGSATNIPLPDNAVDIAVAFEVFEHVQNWRKFLKELQRVVNPSGKLYFSTPNKNKYNPWSKTPINPHHFFEMRPGEFRHALQTYFSIDTFLGQQTPVYNNHWVWRIIDPFLFYSRKLIPYKFNNYIKLKIINTIKPDLAFSDIKFSDDPGWIENSRVLFAICTNSKK